MKRTARSRLFLLVIATVLVIAPLTLQPSTANAEAVFSPEKTETLYVDDLSDDDARERINAVLSDPTVTEVVVIDESLRGAERDGESLVVEPYAAYTVKNRRYNGLLTGTRTLAVATGRPGDTLTITQTKSISNSYSCSASVSTSLISACVGFTVTASESIGISGSAVVPYTVGSREVSSMNLIANPTYDYYSYDVYQGSSFVTTGTAQHAIGVSFRKTYSYK